MRRGLVAGAALTVALAGCIPGVLRSRGTAATGSVLTSALREGARDGTAVDLGKVVDDGWTRAVFVCPYQDQATADEMLGFHWSGFPGRLDSEGSSYFVFANATEVLVWAEVGRDVADPCRLSDSALRADSLVAHVVARQGAVFRVVDDQRLVRLGSDADRAYELCDRAHPAESHTSATLTTIGAIRRHGVGPGRRPAADAFDGHADAEPGAWCWVMQESAKPPAAGDDGFDPPPADTISYRVYGVGPAGAGREAVLFAVIDSRAAYNGTSGPPVVP